MAARKTVSPTRLTFKPLTPERWADLEKLFGPRGACAGCWCMWWRLARGQWRAQRGAGNRAAFKQVVGANEVPGLLAYSDNQPVGWCAVAPRDAFPSLDRSRVLARVDNQPVWSISCFFIAAAFRRRRVSAALVRAAVDHVARRGGGIIEGYPVEPANPKSTDIYSWTGIASSFRDAGFKEVARRSLTRPIMRRRVRPKKR